MKVYIVGRDDLVATMFVRKGWEVTLDPNKCDLIVFTGGADVSPSLYGEKPIKGVYTNARRDAVEYNFYSTHQGKAPMAGICRGAQFLNVMNEGKLWQDVDRHTKSHILFDIPTQEHFFVTSTHHQMMKPNEYGEVVAFAEISTEREDEFGRVPRRKGEVDAEVVWYKDSRCLCFQPHPEYNMTTCSYFFSLLNRYLGI